MNPVFVFGTGRCGSTHLQRLITSQSGIWIWGEHGGALTPLLSALDAFEQNQQLDHNVFRRLAAKSQADFVEIMEQGAPELSWLNGFGPSSLRRELAGAIDRLFRENLPSGWSGWGFKEILYGLNNSAPEHLLALFPDSRAVFSFRNPRDTIESMIRTWTPDAVKGSPNEERLRKIWEERTQRWSTVMHAFLKLKAANRHLFFVSLERGLKSPGLVLKMLDLERASSPKPFKVEATNRGPRAPMESWARECLDAWYSSHKEALTALFEQALQLEEADFATAASLGTAVPLGPAAAKTPSPPPPSAPKRTTGSPGGDVSSRIPAVLGVASGAQPGSRANTGNFLHAQAARRLLVDYTELAAKRPWTEAELEEIRAGTSHLVFVMANGISVGGGRNEEVLRFQKAAADNVARTDLPVVVFGLGAQAPLAGGDGPIPDETARLMKVISERSKSIAVRGAFTAEVLERIGVKNTTVLGCQSCFWSHKPSFETELPDPRMDVHRPVAFNFTFAGLEKELMRFAVEAGFDLIGQGDFIEGDGSAGPHASARRLSEKATALAAEWTEAPAPERLHQFYDVADWLDHMRRYRFSFGTRFHGNMAALLAGVPALWIAHDSRTKELCEHLALPYTTLAEASRKPSLAALAERADYAPFRAAYPRNYALLYDYLQASGLPHRLPPPERAGAAAAAQGSSSHAPGNPRAVGAGQRVQVQTNTQYDRYPQVFAAARAAALPPEAQDPLKVLSFGASRGDEAFTLAQKYFTADAQRILGVDISDEQVQLARQRNPAPGRVAFELSSPESLQAHGPFDVIFAMSVLCVWPASKSLENINGLFPFDRFASILVQLDEVLVEGGLLAIFNANFSFADTPLACRYRVVPVPGLAGSGFVSKFDPDGARNPAKDGYAEVLFQKVTSA